MPLALQKGLLSTRGWRTIEPVSCLTGTWAPPECTPTTPLTQAASAAHFFCSLFWRKEDEAQRRIECDPKESTLKGQRCSFGRQPSLAPPPRGVRSWPV